MPADPAQSALPRPIPIPIPLPTAYAQSYDSPTSTSTPTPTHTHTFARPLTIFLPFRAPATFAKHRCTRDRHFIRQPLLKQPLPQPRRLPRPPQCFAQELRHQPKQNVAQSFPRRFRLPSRSSHEQRGQWPDCGYLCKCRSVYSCYGYIPLDMHLPGRPPVLVRRTKDRMSTSNAVHEQG
jgi:hypothetical protein